jgi:hypothetical protein
LWILHKCESTIHRVNERLNAYFIPDLKVAPDVRSHDYHVLLTQMIVVRFQNILLVNVPEAIMNFCFFFNAIGQKVLSEEAL